MGLGETDDVDEALPTSCVRCLRKSEWVSDGAILTAAFVPDGRTASERGDGGAEVSVNWEDHAGVEGISLAQHPHAAHGLARVQRAEVDRLNLLPGSLQALLCERQRLEENPHHGNIVFRKGLAKPHVTMIAGALALASSHVPRTNA